MRVELDGLVVHVTDPAADHRLWRAEQRVRDERVPEGVKLARELKLFQKPLKGLECRGMHVP